MLEVQRCLVSYLLNNVNIENDIFLSIGTLTNNKSKKTTGSFKPISTKDEKILNRAINFAYEISAR